MIFTENIHIKMLFAKEEILRTLTLEVHRGPQHHIKRGIIRHERQLHNQRSDRNFPEQDMADHHCDDFRRHMWICHFRIYSAAGILLAYLDVCPELHGHQGQR